MAARKEYRVVPVYDEDDLERRLNELANEGYEVLLTTSAHGRDGDFLVLSRDRQSGRAR